MTEADKETIDVTTFTALKAHAEALEKQLQEVELHSAAKLREAELKAEAVRAGILDLDGLKLLDIETGSGQSTEQDDAVRIIAKLRKNKPWLFSAANSSSTAAVPQAAPIRRKLATEMTLEEWRSARAELLRRR